MRIICCACCAGLALLASCSKPVALEWMRELEGASVSTPLVTEKFIAVGHELGVSVLEPNGSVRCTFATHRDVISAPKSDGQRIYFGSTNYVFYAIDSGCNEIWKYPTADRIKSDPLVDGGRVYVSSYDGRVYALDGASGALVWAFPPTPAPKLDLPPPEPEAAARKRAPAKAKVVEPPPPPPAPVIVDAGDFSYSSPVILNGVIYVGNLDQHLYAINASDGTMRWRFRTDGPVTSTASIDGQRIYFGSNDGNVYAINESGGLLWKFATKDWVNSSARLDGELLVIGSNDRHVYALDPANGNLKWSFETVGPAIAIPAFYKNLVIAAGASGDGALYALQRADGSLFWRHETGAKIESDPVIVGDRLYVSSADRNLYEFVFKRTTDE